MQNVSSFFNAGYSYDANGNVSYDARNNVSIGYNFLNLPQSVTSNGSVISNYVYDATGRKLRKVLNGTSTDYISGIQYTNGSMDFVQTEEGRVINGSGWNYEYTLTDHLGNNRLAFDTRGNTANKVQEDGYLPFGMKVTGSVVASPENKYLYNKKEVQDELGQYDYGARFYDPVIGRWGSIDELAENFEHASPYAYVLNNPINLSDPDGRDTIHLNEITVRDTRQSSANTIPIFLPRPTYTLPQLQPIRPPNPWLLVLMLIFGSMNDPHQSHEQEQMDAIHRKQAIQMAKKTVDDLKKGKTFEGETGDGTEVYGGTGGGMKQADEEFDDIVDPSTVKPNPRIPGARIGKTPDGKTANVRGKSLDGRPTLEIFNPNTRKKETKFRY